MPIQIQKIFTFDPSQVPERNIELFLDHLTEQNPESTQLLISGLQILLPLPDQGPERNTKRQQANAKIRAGLDSV
jgi:hypothetical protein